MMHVVVVVVPCDVVGGVMFWLFDFLPEDRWDVGAP